MVTRLLFAGVAVLFAVAAVAAADPIKLDLKEFKTKAAFDGGENLVGYDENDSRVFLYTNGSATAAVKVPEDGEYTIKIEAGCTKADKEFAQIKVSVGDVVVKDKFDLTAEEQKEYTFTAKLKKGDTKLTIEFLNDKYKENEYDLNFFLYKASLEKK